MSCSADLPRDHQQKQPIGSTEHWVASLGIATQDVSTFGGAVEVQHQPSESEAHLHNKKNIAQQLKALPAGLSSVPRTLQGSSQPPVVIQEPQHTPLASAGTHT